MAANGRRQLPVVAAFDPSAHAPRLPVIGNSVRAPRRRQAGFAPRLRPLGDIDEDEMSFADEENFDQIPALAPLKRLMLLTQQVKRRDPALSWIKRPWRQRLWRAFLTRFKIASCDISKLPELVEEQELATHWEQTLLFLEIVTKNWPLILKEQGCQDPVQRRNAVMNVQAELWRKNPPKFPVIAAGSTGSIPATAMVLDAIAALPLGAVVLPGLDRGIDNEAWDDIDDTHPQHSMKLLLEKMGVERNAVKDFSPPPRGEGQGGRSSASKTIVINDKHRSKRTIPPRQTFERGNAPRRPDRRMA